MEYEQHRSLVGSQIGVKVINNSIWEEIQVAVKVNSFLLAQIKYLAMGHVIFNSHTSKPLDCV